MATLCSLLPVKYCMAAPKLSCGSARTIHLQAFAGRTCALALFSPLRQHLVHARMCDEAVERGRRRRGR